MTHAEPGELVDLAREILPPNDEARVRRHLEACAGCRRSFERLSLVVQVARHSSTLPDDVVRRVRALAAGAQRAPSAPLRARLIFDSFLQPLPSGVRGETPARHLVFRAGDWSVDIRLGSGVGATGLIGQLASIASSEPCHGIAVVTRSEELVVGRALTGPWGEFTLDCDVLRPFTLEILVAALPIEIDLPPTRA